MIEPIRLGTRGSALALWQANTIRDLIIQAHPEQPVELLIADSQGDKDQKTPLAALGGTGVFVKQLEAELLAGNVDLAVHSAKDLPASMPTGLELAAAPVRGVVNDALIMSNGNSLSDLPTGSVVGTSSPRRVASLKHIRPDLKTVNIRGNVQTRIRKVDEGEVDATLLALVGLQRLGLESRVNDTLPLHQFLPAAGQGIVAVQIRADDNRLQKLLQPINHKATWKCLIAERALLRRLNAGCHAALGALSTMQSEE
ncbi:MAG TPA: hydroxymethylbilane synthase, partial [Bacteroidetes bacterium]|nr:hydroxymethylbilane synthase [Bacteroidota bacterium]HEX04479.1 hydroxymethylbilane synthase [Bacteroidota bacterium]